MNTTEILQAARTRIEANWAQGDDKVIGAHRDGPWCAGTACAYLPDSHVSDAIKAVDIIKQVAGIPDGTSIGSWNDAPERTKDEVLAAFDAAIAKSKEAS